MELSKHDNLHFKLNWRIWAMIFSLLYYMPYFFKNMLNGDTAQYVTEIRPILGLIRTWLIIAARPLYFISNILFSTFSLELLTLLGVIVFILVTIKFVEMIFPTISDKFKLLITLLLFVNPFLFYERGWADQFFIQSLITVFYYCSFYFILKHKGKPFNLAKLFIAYIFPIGSLLIGLNYFMPSFFHFIVLCMVMVLKRHVENPFKSIFEILYYASDFLAVVLIGGAVYIAEIHLLWYLVDYNLSDYRQGVDWHRGSNLSIKERFFNLPNKYNMFFNYIGLIFISILLLSKRSTTNAFLFFMVILVYASSYFFYIILDMRSSLVLQFANFYFTFFIAGLVLVKFHSKLSDKNVKILLGSVIFVLSYFYFSSYSYYYVNNKQHKELELLAHNINNYVIDTYKTNNNPPIMLLSAYNMDKVNNNNRVNNKYIINSVFFKVLFINYARAFKGKWLGLPNIISYNIWPETSKTMSYIKDDYLRKKSLELVKSNKIFPHPESVFLYKDIYHVIN